MPAAEFVNANTAPGVSDAALADCAARLIAQGCEYVLVTGTHEPTPKVVNTLYGKDGVVRYVGIPAGLEFGTLLEDLSAVARGLRTLKQASRTKLASLAKPVRSPTVSLVLSRR